MSKVSVEFLSFHRMVFWDPWHTPSYGSMIFSLLWLYQQRPDHVMLITQQLKQPRKHLLTFPNYFGN
jgi:hypothetical protein